MGASVGRIKQAQIEHSQNHYSKKKPYHKNGRAFFLNKSLAMTYFRMGKPQTIIGAERFHF